MPQWGGWSQLLELLLHTVERDKALDTQWVWLTSSFPTPSSVIRYRNQYHHYYHTITIITITTITSSLLSHHHYYHTITILTNTLFRLFLRCRTTHASVTVMVTTPSITSSTPPPAADIAMTGTISGGSSTTT